MYSSIINPFFPLWICKNIYRYMDGGGGCYADSNKLQFKFKLFENCLKLGQHGENL